MNRQRFPLDDLDVEPELLRDVLRCVLHSIVFQRAFGLVRPCEGFIELLDLCYARCDDPNVEKLVEKNIETTLDTLRKQNLRQFQLVVTWSEKKKESSWLGVSDKKVPWEEWALRITITPNKEATISEQRKGVLEQELRNRLVTIVKLVNEHKSHIPPLTSKDVLPFPFDVAIPNGTPDGGKLDMLWNIIKAPTNTFN